MVEHTDVANGPHVTQLSFDVNTLTKTITESVTAAVLAI